MRKIWCLLKTAVFFSATILFVSACGGGSGGGTTPSTTLSGKAAAGAPIIGSVTIKDSTTPTAKTKTVPIAADGNYLVDVSDLKAPYMVRADGYVGGNEYHLYSASTSGGTVNITPLTDLIVANIVGSVAKTYFDNGSFSKLTDAQLTAQSEALKAKLLPVLQALGVSSSIDLLRASFSTDHTGLDAALDVLRVDTTAGVATITNVITNQQITSTLATGSYSGTMTDTNGMGTALTDIQMISDGFKRFSALFATSVPGEANATLLALFDSATFMQGGQTLTSFLSEITTNPSMIGISFANISIITFDVATGRALVGFTVFQHGKVQTDAPEAWYMIKKNGAWYMQGDQRLASISIKPRAEYRSQDTSSQISTGLNINIEDRGSQGITSAVVTGKGFTGGSVTMINQINQSWFVFQNTQLNNQNFYNMTDQQIGAIADTGEIYTVVLYKGTTPAATYTEKLRKRPYLNFELTAASFATITAPTPTALRAFNGGTITVSWTAPAGLTPNWLDFQMNDNSGNSSRAEYGSMLPTATSQNVTLQPVTSTGQTFTPTNRFIWFSFTDSFGRELATSM